jgi:hypothetical protein
MSNNIVEITWRPLTQWPAGRKRTYGNEDARFTRRGSETRTVNGIVQRVALSRERIPLGETLRELDRELSMLGVYRATVQIDVESDRELRNLRDLTHVKSSAVVLTFERNKQPVTIATDFFSRWQDNLRAIAKGMESLRLLERYHIANTGDQYRGWTALPATTTPAFSTEQAANYLARFDGDVGAAAIMQNAESARHAYRCAVAKTHPDAGGSVGNAQLTQEARRVLEAHLGVKL